MSHRIHNFFPGPAALPLAVLEEAQRDLVELPGTGASVLELSHRSKRIEEVLETAAANIRRLLGLPGGYHVLFLQGGANLQFSMVPMNFLRDTGRPAEYVNTGSWATKAIEEAEREGAVRTIWDGKAGKYSSVPKPGDLEFSRDAAYVHITSNETIEGIQFQEMPDTEAVPLVCDSSSDFISRPIPAERFALIYAGAQKNAGPAGVTLVILREDLLERIPDGLHTMLDYRTHAKSNSLFNTPPVFGIYIVMLVTRWLLDEIGGLAKMAEINRRKAETVYRAIDGSGGFYRGHARSDSRSAMNVTWRLPSEELEKAFVKEAEAVGLYGLKGHRSVGGIRASLYNAVTPESVHALCGFMTDFLARRG
jgi:phosphoserine aminotransferase